MQRQPTSTHGKLVPTDVKGIYRRDARFVVRWTEDGRRRIRSFSTVQSAVAFRRDYVTPFRDHVAFPPSLLVPKRSDTGWVYFFQSRGGDKSVKIGWSRDPATRMKALSTAHPHGLSLVALVPGGREMEARLHRDFIDYCHGGEWFSSDVLLLLAARLLHP